MWLQFYIFPAAKLLPLYQLPHFAADTIRKQDAVVVRLSNVCPAGPKYGRDPLCRVPNQLDT
jgi:hypothetical protein